jgi:small subunit ribosomal protein S2
MTEEIDIPAEESTEDFLVPLDDYLSNGVHVGLKYRTEDMREFIYKIRPDKLCVFDVRKINDRLKMAAEFISKYDPKDIVVVSNRVYGRRPVKMFCEHTGCKAIEKRFVSGTFTNPQIEDYAEAKLIIITDPSSDQQAINEASVMGIPVVAICDTNTRSKGIDYIIPSNNKGKNSLALIYWILTKELLKRRGIDKFGHTIEDFLSKAEPQPYLLKMQELQRKQRRKSRGSGRGR